MMNATIHNCNVTASSNYTCSTSTYPRISIKYQFHMSKIFLISVYGIVFVLGAAGNSFVAMMFGTKQERKKPGSKLVIVLAVNDFMSSIFVPLLQIQYLVSRSINVPKLWFLGKFLCHSLSGLQISCLLATSLLLTTISLERFRYSLFTFYEFSQIFL